MSSSLRSSTQGIHRRDSTRTFPRSRDLAAEPGRSDELGPAADAGRSDELGRAADALIELLRRGRDLLESLPDDDYAAPLETTTQATDATWASPGAHTRHLLDFVDCLLSGIDARRIDYTARKRRPEVETSRDAGAGRIERAIAGLERLREHDGRMPIEVRPESGQDWTRSTLSRELQFVSHHVVHHHALIRLTLAVRGVEAPPELGIAPSTLAHRAEQAR